MKVVPPEFQVCVPLKIGAFEVAVPAVISSFAVGEVVPIPTLGTMVF